jgi:hypothetical protein
VNKAMIERLTQLTLAAQGKPTKRPLEEILLAERLVAKKFLPRQPITKTPEGTGETAL